MLPLRYVLQWRIASGILLLLVLLATLAPVVWLWPDRVRVVNWIRHIDKWAHGASFAVLALWFCGQYAKHAYWRIAIGLVLFGIAIEGCQRLVGYRTADVMDVAANATGIALGLSLGLLGLGGWSQQFEHWYSRRGDRGVSE